MPSSIKDAAVAWKQFVGNEPFIVDLGFTPGAPAASGGAPLPLGRFGVFLPTPDHSGHQIVEVGADLEALKARYGVPDGRVLQVGGAPAQLRPDA